MGYYSKLHVGDFLLEAQELHIGEKILIIGPTTGVIELTVNEVIVDDRKVDVVHKGERFTIVVPAKVRPSDRLYRLVPNHIEA
jgi:putative protease